MLNVLDVTDVKYVINFDFPNNTEDYIHRIGRTARAENTGTAYTFFTTQVQYMYMIMCPTAHVHVLLYVLDCPTFHVHNTLHVHVLLYVFDYVFHSSYTCTCACVHYKVGGNVFTLFNYLDR